MIEKSAEFKVSPNLKTRCPPGLSLVNLINYHNNPSTLNIFNLSFGSYIMIGLAVPRRLEIMKSTMQID